MRSSGRFSDDSLKLLYCSSKKCMQSSTFSPRPRVWENAMSFSSRTFLQMVLMAGMNLRWENSTLCTGCTAGRFLARAKATRYNRDWLSQHNTDQQCPEMELDRCLGICTGPQKVRTRNCKTPSHHQAQRCFPQKAACPCDREKKFSLVDCHGERNIFHTYWF